MCYKLVWAPSTAVLYLSISKNLSVTLRLLQMYLSRICDLEWRKIWLKCNIFAHFLYPLRMSVLYAFPTLQLMDHRDHWMKIPRPSTSSHLKQKSAMLKSPLKMIKRIASSPHKSFLIRMSLKIILTSPFAFGLGNQWPSYWKILRRRLLSIQKSAKLILRIPQVSDHNIFW